MRTTTRREFIQAGTALALAPSLRAWAKETGFPLAICNETFQDASFAAACRAARKAGFTGLEIAPFTLSPDPVRLPASRRRELRSAMADEGVAFVGLHWLLKTPAGLHVTAPDDALRKRSWDYVRRLVDLSADLGDGGVLVFGSGKARSTTGGTSRAEAVRRFEEGLAGVAPHAESRGATFALEPLARPYSDILNTLDETAGVVRRLGSPAVQTMVDCRHTALLGAQADLAQLVATHREHICHVHINERDGRHPGTGEFPFEDLLGALRRVSYGGWLSLEVFDFEAGGPRIAEETVRFVREVERHLDDG